MSAYFAELTGQGETPSSLSGKSNVTITTTVELFGSDTLYLHSVLLCCQACVKLDLGRDIYTEAYPC